MPFHSRALNVARQCFGDSGTKLDVTSTQGPTTIAPRSYFSLFCWDETTQKYLFSYPLRLKSSNFVLKSCLLCPWSPKMLSCNSKINFITEVEIEQANDHAQYSKACKMLYYQEQLPEDQCDEQLLEDQKLESQIQAGDGSEGIAGKKVPGILKGPFKYNTEAVRLNGKLFYSCPFSPTATSPCALAMLYLLQEECKS